MTNLLFRILVIFLILFGVVPLDALGSPEDKKTNREVILMEKAFHLANKEAVRLGYPINEMEITIRNHSQFWNECLPKGSLSNSYVFPRQKILKGKTYWGFYYYPASTTVEGGFLCVFVDAKGNKVLTTVRGQ